MKVLIVPEDPTLDQYILKPLVERMFADLGKAARVTVLTSPRIRGVDQALDASVLADVVATYPMVDLFLVLVDRDGKAARAVIATAREAEHAGKLMVCLAIEEIEVWMLALHRSKLGAPWSDVREEPHPKERYSEPFLRSHAPREAPGRGRAWAMRDLGKGFRGMLDVCAELADLRARLESAVASTA